jgi:hypothetical protein
LTYENPDFGLTIQYPADWYDKGIPFMNQILTGSIVSFSPSSNIYVDFHVSVYKPNDIWPFPYSNTTLSELVDREIDELTRQRYGFRDISSEPTTLASNPAYKIVYYGSGSESKTMEIWTLKYGKAYKIEYTAIDALDNNLNKQTGISQFSYYLPIAQKMIDSFKINDATATTVPPAQPSSDSSALLPKLIILFLIIIAIITLIIRKIRGRQGGKYRERYGFPDYIMEEVLCKQKLRCAHCNRILNVVDWHHIDGDRSNNKESNCQALCPNCHAVKTCRGDR